MVFCTLYLSVLAAQCINSSIVLIYRELVARCEHHDFSSGSVILPNLIKESFEVLLNNAKLDFAFEKPID